MRVLVILGTVAILAAAPLPPPAGIEPGDAILKFGDLEVGSAEELADAIRSRKPGSVVKVVLRRDGKELVVEVVLGRRL